MAKGKKYHKSISKEVKAKCRVCQKVMLRQGYRDHLANVHLDQDPRDLRQHGEQTLFSFRGQNTSEDSEGVRNENNESGGLTERGGGEGRSRSRSPLSQLPSSDPLKGSEGCERRYS